MHLTAVSTSQKWSTQDGAQIGVSLCHIRDCLLYQNINNLQKHQTYFIQKKRIGRGIQHDNTLSRQLMHWDTFKQDNYSTVGGKGGCRVGEVRADTTLPPLSGFFSYQTHT